MRMKRWSALFVAWIGLAAAAAQAQGDGANCPPQATLPTPQQVQDAQARATDRGFLWRVSKDGRTHHLYGTIHVGALDWVFPGPKVRAAMMDAQAIALELDPLDPALQTRLRGSGSPKLAPALAAQLSRQVQRTCLPAEALSGLHPMMQAVTVLLMEAARDGLHAAYGQEFALAGFARARQLRVISLETAERQLAALIPADPVQAERAVAMTVAQIDSGLSRRVLQRMAAAWARGDLDELAAYERWCDCMNTAEEQALMRALNDERNPAMADKVAALHGEGRRLFVAVGALHMTGPQALPALLRARGFQVERVAFQ
jgi:uncharacterized protein YbaP (TraB family)